MRHLATLTTMLLLVVFTTTGPALANSPHFTKGPTGGVDASDGDLTVCFKEAGLGNDPITYKLTAGTATFTYQCFTKSDNEPQGEPNSVSFSADSTFITITPRNGQITGCISLSPQQDGASCQGHGLKLKLIRVKYEGVTFEDFTDGIVFNLGDFGPTDIAH